MYLSTISIILIALFLSSLVFPLVTFGSVIQSAGKRAGMSFSKIRKIQIWVLGFFICWWGFASFLSISGLLYGNELPPRPIVFLVIPFTLFLFLVVNRNATFTELFEAVEIETLINIHIFRLIGGWFLIMGYLKLLPMGFAMRAGLGDILSGLLALLVSHLVFKKKTLNIKWAYAWNIFGLIDILAVVISAVIITLNANVDPTSPIDVLELTKFPFALIPAFAPALIVFLHVLTFKKLNIIRKQGML